MAAEPDEFEIGIVQNCPSDGAYYYLLRYGQNNEAIRFPLERALRIRGPFEHPIGCKPGSWLAIYTSDHLGHNKIQHIGSRSHVEVRLSLPQSVCEAAGASADNEKLLDILTKSTDEEDDDEGSLKATRIEAKKREIALDLANKQDRLLRRTGRSKELTEGFMLNREHRLEVRAQSEAMFRLQNQSVVMMERTFVLMEKMQEVFGRFTEIEKTAAQKMASPPPPPDYSPVLNSVVTAIRDIGVSALQRDEKRKLKSEDESSPVRASLTDSASSAVPADSSTARPQSAVPASPQLAQAQPGKEGVAELSASLQRIQAERDRLKSELDAERKRQRVLDEMSAGTRIRTPVSGRSSQAPNPHIQRSIRPTRTAESLDEARPSSASEAVRAAMQSQPAGSVEPMPAAGREVSRKRSRNAACSCGSGRRYRRCCGRKDRQSTQNKQDEHRTERERPISVTVPPPPPMAMQQPAPIVSPTLASKATTPQHSVDPRPDAAPALPDSSAIGTPQPASAPIGPGAEASEVRDASVVDGTHSQTPVSASQEPQGTQDLLPPGVVREEMQELLVNMLAGKLLNDPDAPIPPPLVSQVKQVEEVLVAPPKMDRETALKLLKDGSMLEAFGAFLFFNPALRTALLSRRGK